MGDHAPGTWLELETAARDMVVCIPHVCHQPSQRLYVLLYVSYCCRQGLCQGPHRHRGKLTVAVNSAALASRHDLTLVCCVGRELSMLVPTASLGTWLPWTMGWEVHWK